MPNISQTDLIADINDAYRRNAGWEYLEQESSPPGNFTEAKARRILSQVWQAIRSYQSFGPEDSEHASGTVEVEEIKVHWCINYLDRWSDALPANPADVRVTRRSITITMELPDD